MVTDIVERLRARKALFLNGAMYMLSSEPDRECHEAADAIERLRADYVEVLDGNNAMRDEIERLYAANVTLRAEIDRLKQKCL